MLLGYKKTFSAYVADGSKPHTLRTNRKKTPRIGETLHEYEALRSKYTRLIRNDRKLVSMQHIRFKVVNDCINFWADGVKMPQAALTYFVWVDGFRNGPLPDWKAFRAFFGLIMEGNYWEGTLFHATDLRYTPDQDWIEKIHDVRQLKIEFSD